MKGTGMHFNSKKIGWLFFALLPIVYCFNFCSSLEFTDTVEKTFQVKQGGTLNLESDLGSIDVNTGNSDLVQVIIKRKVNGRNKNHVDRILENLEIRFDQQDDDVYVNVEYDQDNFFNWKKSRIQLKFEIIVPVTYNLDLKTAGGGIKVKDIEGEVRSKTSGGGLKFGNIKGPVWGNTSGGGIDLTSCSSKADLSTSGGSINIGYVDGIVNASTSGGSIHIKQAKASVSAHTSGGSINVNEVMGQINASTSGGSVTAHLTLQPESDCKLTTSGGNIDIYVKSFIKADINASTSGGKVTTDFPVTIQGEIKKTKLMAKINGGGPQLYMRTSGGSIRIHEI
jgi:hypothetical protein